MAIKLSDYIVQLGRRDGYPMKFLAHWCPACQELHPLAVEAAQPNGAIWNWNGDAYYPTFNPSMNIHYGPDGEGEDEVKQYRCHYYLEKGEIRYLSDCTHHLRGQTVALPEIPLGEMSRLLANEAG